MYIDKYISQSRRGTDSLVIKLRGYCSSRSVPWHNVPHRKGTLCWWWRSTSHKFQVTAGYIFHTIFWYIFVPCSYIYNYIHQIWTCFCLWMSMGQTRIICSIPKTQTTSDLRLPGQTHTHTFWPVVIDMFKRFQKSQENESRAIKKTNMFTLKRVTVSSCSWVRQLYPVFAPLHSSCKGGNCYHGQKVWVRASAI